MKMTLNVNGKPVAITADDPQMPLLYALRDDLGLRPTEKPWGAGEPTAAIVPAAIANAIYNATGALGREQEVAVVEQPGRARSCISLRSSIHWSPSQTLVLLLANSSQELLVGMIQEGRTNHQGLGLRAT